MTTIELGAPHSVEETGGPAREKKPRAHLTKGLKASLIMYNS